MNKFLAYLVAVQAFVFAFCVSATAQKVVALRSADSTVVSASPVDLNTVIKFSEDSVFLYNGAWHHQVPVSDVASLTHDEVVCSSFDFLVVADNEWSMPVESIYVTLHGDAFQDYYAVTQMSDGEGVASFGNLPAGFYSAYLTDSQGRFLPVEMEKVVHGFSDAAVAAMKEIVVSPYDVKYWVWKTADGLHTVKLRWAMYEDDSMEGLFHDYLFVIYINGEYAGETSEKNFYLEGLDFGEYEIVISCISRYGNPSSEPYELTVSIERPEDPETAGVSLTEVGIEDFIYYDLNGVEVLPSNLSPGIYIGISSSGQVKKILVR